MSNAEHSLNNLSKDFKPDHVSFTFALDKNLNVESCIESANAALKRLQAYVENGCSTAGLDFKYKSVKKFS